MDGRAVVDVLSLAFSSSINDPICISDKRAYYSLSYRPDKSHSSRDILHVYLLYDTKWRAISILCICTSKVGST